MGVLKQIETGKWNMTIKIDTQEVPSNVFIPTTFTYENITYTFNVSTQEQTFATDWATPLGTAIDVTKITWSADSVQYGNARYTVEVVRWDSIIPYGQSVTRYEVVVTPVDTAIVCSGTTTCSAKYNKYVDNQLVSSEDLNVRTMIWMTSDDSVAVVREGIIRGVNETTITKNVSITGVYREVAGMTTIAVGGTSGGSGGGGRVEPTGITLDKSSVRLTTCGDKNREKIVATVKPDSATDKTVIWRTSDNSVAYVQRVNGTYYIHAQYNPAKVGTAVISAYTYDMKHCATCNVNVRAAGTFVTDVNPSTVTVPAASSTKQINVTTVDLENYHSGYGCFVPMYETPTFTYNDNGVLMKTKTNYGNARTFKVYISGNFSGDEGKVVTVNQEGSTVIREFKYWDVGYCYRNGVFYHKNGTEGITGILHYVCAIGYGRNIPQNVTMPSWIHFGINSGIVSTDAYTTAELEEYDRYGTINGKDPGFQGMTATYWIQVNVDENTTGAKRTGTLVFPGNKKFKIYQEG